MKLLPLLLLSAALLSACTPEERAAQITVMESKLPEGCKIEDVGRYGTISHVLVVQCPDRWTSSVNFTEPQGKTSAHRVILSYGK